MIKLEIRDVSSERIGIENGLNLPQLFEESRQKMHQGITQLYETKNQEGGWKKWLNLPYEEQLYRELEQYSSSVKGKFLDLVVLGIGGSSLGGYALLKALLHPYWNNLSQEQRNGFPRFHFVENVDSDQMVGLLDILDPNTTLVNVISKSGTTAETMSAFMLFKSWLEAALGHEQACHHIVATTDKEKGILRPIANEEKYPTFEVPDDVGGRFSIFSAVGLLPAILCGVDIREIQRGLKDLDTLLQNPNVEENPAAQNALIQYAFYQRGKPISVFMPYSYRLAPVSDWYVQLWAESLGKKFDCNHRVVHVGPTPVRAVGVTDQHSQIQLYNEGPLDKVITFVQVENPEHEVKIPKTFTEYEDLAYLGNRSFQELLTAEFDSTRASLTRNQRPHVTLQLPKVDPYHFAQLLYLLEVQTALAGELFNIDPFDQPGVELAKKYTHALMGRKGYESLIPEAKGEIPSPV